MSDDSSNQGYSFLATVIASGIVGYGVDFFFPTQPWGLIGFMIIGIVYATYKAQKAMNNPASSGPGEKDDKKA